MSYESGEPKPGIAEAPPTVEQAKPKSEQKETLLESLEQDIEKRFGEMKRRLQEIDVTLTGSEDMIKMMKDDFEGAQALGEDGQEEGEQLVEYMFEMDQAKLEQKRLREKLQTLLTVADEGELKKRFAATEAAEEAAIQKASQEARSLTLDELNEKRDAADKADDIGMVNHLESEMLDKLQAMGIATAEQGSTESPEAAQDRTPDSKITERAAHFTSLQQRESLALHESGGVVTSDIRKIRTEMLQIARAQFGDLHSKTLQPEGTGWQELANVWEEAVNRLQGVSSEQSAPSANVEAPKVEDVETAKSEVTPRDPVLSADAEDAQNGAEDVILKAHVDQPGAEIIATPELQKQQAEFLAVPSYERYRMYDRLVLRQKWSQEKAGGAVTDEVRAIHEELRALAPLIRKDMEERGFQPGDKAKVIAEWDQKIATLAQDPATIERSSVSKSQRFDEEMRYSSSLARSAGDEIGNANGTVTERAKALLREAIAIDRKQLAEIESGESGMYDAPQRAKEWKANIRELEKMLGERVDGRADTEEGREGIRSAEGTNEILTQTTELIGESEKNALSSRFTELNNLLGRISRRHGPQFEEMGLTMDGLLSKADEVTDEVRGAQEKFDNGELTQEEFDQMIMSVGEELQNLERDVSKFAEEFENYAGRVQNHLYEGKRDNDAEAAGQLISYQIVDLKEFAESLARKRASWQTLEDHAQSIDWATPSLEQPAVKKEEDSSAQEQEAEMAEGRMQAMQVLERSMQQVDRAERGWNEIVTQYERSLGGQLVVQLRSPAFVGNQKIEKSARVLMDGLPGFYKGIQGLHTQIRGRLSRDMSSLREVKDSRALLEGLGEAQSHIKEYQLQVAAIMKQVVGLGEVGAVLMAGLDEVGKAFSSDGKGDTTNRVTRERSNLQKTFAGLHEGISAASKNSEQLQKDFDSAARSLQASLQAKESKRVSAV